MATLQYRLRVSGIKQFPPDYWEEAASARGIYGQHGGDLWPLVRKKAAARKMEHRYLARAVEFESYYYDRKYEAASEDTEIPWLQARRLFHFQGADADALVLAGLIPLAASSNEETGQKVRLLSVLAFLPYTDKELRCLLLEKGEARTAGAADALLSDGKGWFKTADVEGIFGLPPGHLASFTGFSKYDRHWPSGMIGIEGLRLLEPYLAVSDSNKKVLSGIIEAIEKAESLASVRAELNKDRDWLNQEKAKKKVRRGDHFLLTAAILGFVRTRDINGQRQFNADDLVSWAQLADQERKAKIALAAADRRSGELPEPVAWQGKEPALSVGQICSAVGLPFPFIADRARSITIAEGKWRQAETLINAADMVRLSKGLSIDKGSTEICARLVALLSEPLPLDGGKPSAEGEAEIPAREELDPPEAAEEQGRRLDPRFAEAKPPEGYKFNPALVERKSERLNIAVTPTLKARVNKFCSENEIPINRFVEVLVKEFLSDPVAAVPRLPGSGMAPGQATEDGPKPDTVTAAPEPSPPVLRAPAKSGFFSRVFGWRRHAP